MPMRAPWYPEFRLLNDDQVDALGLIGQSARKMTAETALPKTSEEIRFANEMTMDEAWRLARPKRPGLDARYANCHGTRPCGRASFSLLRSIGLRDNRRTSRSYGTVAPYSSSSSSDRTRRSSTASFISRTAMIARKAIRRFCSGVRV